MRSLVCFLLLSIFSGNAAASNATATAAPTSSSSLNPITNANIHHAVKEWMRDPVAAEATFGHIKDWDTSKVHDMSHLFSWERHNTLSQFNESIGNWDTSKVHNLSHAFFGNAALNIELHWNVSNVKDMSGCFANTKAYVGHGLRTWDTKNVVDMSTMFLNAQALDNNGIHLWDTRSLVNASRMFMGANAYHGNHHFGWKSHNLEDITEMFAHADVFTGSLNDMDVRKVKTMKGTFFKAFKFNGNLSKWDTHNVEDMNSMFAYAHEFVGTGLDKWNVGKVTNMANMLKRTNFNQNVSSWQVEQVTDMRNAFRYASKMKEKICWKLNDNVNADGIFFQSKAFFDKKCVKHAVRVHSCCHPRLDNACECGETTVNEDHEVQSMGGGNSSSVKDDGSIGATSFFSNGSKNMMALGVASIVLSVLLLAFVLRRAFFRKSVTTIDIGGDDEDPDISDLDMTMTPIQYSKNGGSPMSIPATSTKSFSSHGSDEDDVENLAVREII